jgi:hypothetical protein
MDLFTRLTLALLGSQMSAPRMDHFAVTGGFALASFVHAARHDAAALSHVDDFGRCFKRWEKGAKRGRSLLLRRSVRSVAQNYCGVDI